MNIREHLHDTFVPHARNNYQPFALGRRPLSLYAAFLVAVKVLTLVSLAALPENQAFSASLSSANILKLTNSSRSSFNLEPLQENVFLAKAAQSKASDMAKFGYFSHISPQGKTPWTFIKEAGYNYAIAGENLAINFYTAEGVEAAWMNSAGHKANILNKDFDEIGIGIASGIYKGSKAVFVVQMFGARVDRPLIPKNEFTILGQKNIEPIQLPASKLEVLAAPVLSNDNFTLTNQKNFEISGRAEGAEEVYILINNKPVYKFNVFDNKFSGNIELSEGDNSINVLSYYGGIISSPQSESVLVKLDSNAPRVIDVDTQFVNKQIAAIKVKADSEVAKVLVTAGNETIMLKPAENSGSWLGQFDSSKLKGKLLVRAYDMAGNQQVLAAADFSANVLEAYGFQATQEKIVNFLGKDLAHPQVNQLNGFFVAGLLGLLGTNMGLRRNVQSLPRIAETVGFILFILLLWMI